MSGTEKLLVAQEMTVMDVGAAATFIFPCALAAVPHALVTTAPRLTPLPHAHTACVAESRYGDATSPLRP